MNELECLWLSYISTRIFETEDFQMSFDVLIIQETLSFCSSHPGTLKENHSRNFC